MLNIKSDLDMEQVIARISMIKGIESVSISKEDMWKEDIEAWKDWTDEDETNYLKSIPGMWEKILASQAEPLEAGSTTLKWE